MSSTSVKTARMPAELIEHFQYLSQQEQLLLNQLQAIAGFKNNLVQMHATLAGFNGDVVLDQSDWTLKEHVDVAADVPRDS